MLDLGEEALAPVDVAFRGPALEIVLDAPMAGQGLVEEIARARMELLQRQDIGLENLHEALQGVLPEIPAMIRPDVVRDEADSEWMHVQSITMLACLPTREMRSRSLLM